MASGVKDSNNIDSWGDTQSWAVVWFCGAIIVGASLTYVLSGIDFHLYKTNAETLDYTRYRNNRKSGAAIPKDSIDQRVFGDLRKAKEGS